MSYTVKKKWIYGVIFLVSLVVYLLKITMLNKSGNSPADAGEWTLAVSRCRIFNSNCSLAGVFPDLGCN